MLIWVLLESVHLKTQEAFELRWTKNGQQYCWSLHNS
jgi:hypothetical protein